MSAEFRFAVNVTPKPGILDPQGRAVEGSLGHPRRGYASVRRADAMRSSQARRETPPPDPRWQRRQRATLSDLSRLGPSPAHSDALNLAIGDHLAARGPDQLHGMRPSQALDG